MTALEQERKIKLDAIEMLRKDKEELKQKIQELSLQVMNKDISIREIRQSIPELEHRIEEQEEIKKERMSVQEAREVIKRWESEYDHAKQIFFLVKNAKQTLTEYGVSGDF